MNETLNTLLNRRSIRAYKDEQIKEEELQAIVQAGLYAPSAMGQQSWHITVVQNKEVITKLIGAIKEGMKNAPVESLRKAAENEKYNPFYGAPTYVIVSGDNSAFSPRVDCAAANENMLLAAASLGIGSCWLGSAEMLFASEKGAEFKKELGIPENYTPFYSAVFGYPASNNAKAAPRKDNTVNYIR